VQKREAADNNNEDDEEHENISDEVLVYLVRNNHSSVFPASHGVFSQRPKTLDKLCSVRTVWPSR
jgi:hypothetical protein